MSFSKIAALTGLIAFASKAASHGHATGIIADGVYYEGYSPEFQYMSTQPVVVGWSTPEDLSNGFVAPDAYSSSDIICHLGATNAQTSATVKAGGTVEVQWTTWPSSHHGPVIDYLANCNGDCTTVDKTTLEFFKIDGVGLLDDTTVPGDWASDTLIANNNSWTVAIPTDIAPGNYVLRHEIIALHSAGSLDGAQNYPQCFNLQVTGSGTATPSGTLGEALYSETEPGIEINIYQSLSTYIVPGPTLYSGATGISQTAPASVSSSAVVSSMASLSLSSGGMVTASASAPTITSSPAPTQLSSSAAPYLNTTTSRKSVCKAKSSRASMITSAPVIGAVSTSNVFIATTETVSPTPIATSTNVSSIIPFSSESALPSVTASSAPEPTPTSSGDVTMPSGTTLSDLLSWLSSFYSKFKGTSYTGNSVARRHSRDVAAPKITEEEIHKFDGMKFGGPGTGFAQPTGHNHPHHHHHPHGTGVFGGPPTGIFLSAGMKPTGAGKFRAGHF